MNAICHARQKLTTLLRGSTCRRIFQHDTCELIERLRFSTISYDSCLGRQRPNRVSSGGTSIGRMRQYRRDRSLEEKARGCRQQDQSGPRQRSCRWGPCSGETCAYSLSRSAVDGREMRPATRGQNGAHGLFICGHRQNNPYNIDVLPWLTPIGCIPIIGFEASNNAGLAYHVTEKMLIFGQLTNKKSIS